MIVVHIQSIGNVTFFQNARSRSIRLRVKPDQTILVSFPSYVSFRKALQFAEQHAGWILTQRRKIEDAKPKYSEDTTIQTRFHKITFHRSGEKVEIKQNHEEIKIMFPETSDFNGQEMTQLIHGILTEIYRREANKYLQPRLSALAERHGFQYANLTIRNNKTNWGSCSGRNNISLNLKLMKLPDHLIDFIILHELVHTRIKNHSPGFWILLDSITGNQARKLTAELKRYSATVK